MTQEERERIIRVVEDLMESHDQLMAGVRYIVVDYKLLNECRIEGQTLLNELRRQK